MAKIIYAREIDTDTGRLENIATRVNASFLNSIRINNFWDREDIADEIDVQIRTCIYV